MVDMFKWLIILAIYLPFQLALNPGAGVDLASLRVLIPLFFLVWLAQGLLRKKISLPRNIQTILILSFLFLNALSILVSRNTDWSIRKLLFLFSLFPVYFVAGAVINSKEKAEKIIQALIDSGMVVALMGIIQFSLQFIIGWEKIYQFWSDYLVIPFLGRSFGTAVLKNPSWLVNISGQTILRATAVFPDPHMFSFYLGLLIPLALGMFLARKKAWLLAGFILMLAADILTFSRGGYLGLAAGFIFLIVLFWKKISKNYKIAVIISASLIFLGVIIPNPVSNRFFSSFNLKEGSNQGRLKMWKAAETVILDNPLLGVGIGNYPLEVKPSADYREPIYAHNTYLDIAAESGIINGAIWIGLLLSTIISFWRRKDMIFSMMAVGLIIFSVHSLVETGIYSPTVLTLLLILISFSAIKNEKAA
ncbi:MAG: O-antigen ligase family protein [Candidatus Moranbacteria bacterium]|nr:O-antigen ligase family protein [Candidatus Moranbacteria bacterium]